MNKLLPAVVTPVVLVAGLAVFIKLVDKSVFINPAFILTLFIAISPPLFTLSFFIVNFSNIRKRLVFFLIGIFMGYALLVLIPFIILLIAFILHSDAGAEFGVMYVMFSWPILVISSLLSAYFAYKKTIEKTMNSPTP